MAGKIVEFFGLNRGVWPFYTACCLDELGRWSVLCLLNVSFKTAVSQRHNSIFWAKIDDHGVRRGDTGQILNPWRHMVASRVALDLLYWAMRTALCRLIRMAVKITSKGGELFCHCQIVVVHNPRCRRPCYGQLKIKPSYTIVHYYVLI
jgi:hypothetical protein